jgi:glycosyltransferase
VGGQVETDLEHIFIDGYSSDRTISIINKYMESSTYKTKLYQSKPSGISKAMNEGIRRSRGKYIYFLNSDDFMYDKNVLLDVKKLLSSMRYIDLLYGRINTVDEEGKSLGFFPNQWFFKIANPYLLKFINFIPHQAAFVKKEVFDKHGLFDEGLKTEMDVEYWLRIRKETKWDYIDRVIACFRVHDDSNSTSSKNKKRNRQIADSVKAKHLNILEQMIYKLYIYIVRRIFH